MALIDDFKARFTEFDTVTVDAVFSSLESSYSSYFGGSYSSNVETILQLLAHLFVVETVMNQAMGGVIDDKNEDPESFFRLSKYGQRYLALIKHNYGARPV